jgi:hypothetical protein
VAHLILNSEVEPSSSRAVVLDCCRGCRSEAAPAAVVSSRGPLAEGWRAPPGLLALVRIGATVHMEDLSLRTKDLDFGRGTVTIRDGKGQKDRVAMLPGVLRQPLRDHLRQVREQQDSDSKVGWGRGVNSPP